MEFEVEPPSKPSSYAFSEEFCKTGCLCSYRDSNYLYSILVVDSAGSTNSLLYVAHTGCWTHPTCCSMVARGPCLCSPDRLWDTPNLLLNGCKEPFPRLVERPWREADQSPGPIQLLPLPSSRRVAWLNTGAVTPTLLYIPIHLLYCT
jgi:hypothetical protein